GGGVRPQMGVSPQAGVIPPQTQTPMPTIPGAVSPIAGSVSGQPGMGFPPSQMGITGGTITPAGGSLTIGQTPEIKAEQELWQESQKKQIAFSEKIKESKVVSKYNFDLVAGNLRDYAEILADSYKEGGSGDIYKATLSSAVEKGIIPSSMSLASKFPRTSALKGKMFEVVGKAFPMITQQIGKEGSVRLIQSIFERFESTIPQKNTPPANSPEMMKTTVQSFYRVQRAFDVIDLNNYDLKSKQGLNSLIEDTAKQAKSIKIMGEEKEALDSLMNSVVEPLNDYLSTKKYTKTGVNKKGQRVGMLSDGTVEVINGEK
ncbi:MAG: hypothetical protein KJ718_01200, partial [Nanoarchaeota archaeon]|nr:hypothetical protein [Nanoarchaeota archaeon]